MNLIFRFLRILIFYKFQSPVGKLDKAKTAFRVWPTDLDILFHMNNGKYFSLMDLGRVDQMLRSGLHHKFKKGKVYPVVVSEMIRFKKSLKLFQKFYIETQVIGWDDKTVYLNQRFIFPDGTLAAQAFMKAQFLKTNGKKVSSQELLEIIEYKGEKRPLPDFLKNWNEDLEKQTSFNYQEPHLESTV